MAANTQYFNPNAPGLTPTQKHRRAINAYGKLPQWAQGSRTAPTLTQAQKDIVAQVYARFGTPEQALNAWARRNYRQKALGIPNVSHASRGQIATARRHHALGGTSMPAPPPPVEPRDTGLPPDVSRDPVDTGLPVDAAVVAQGGVPGPLPGKPVQLAVPPGVIGHPPPRRPPRPPSRNTLAYLLTQPPRRRRF